MTSWEDRAVDEAIEKEEAEYNPPLYCPACGNDLCFEVQEVWRGKFKNIMVMKDTIYCPRCGWEEQSE